METTYFLAILFLVTALAFIFWALVSKRRTDRRHDDPNAPKSALATDGPGPNPVTAPRGVGAGHRPHVNTGRAGRD